MSLPSTMQACRFENGKLLVKEVPTPQPTPGEAIIKVIAAGICSTDLEICKGYMGFNGTLGHEFIGEIVALHDADVSKSSLPLGSRVVGEINCACGTCEFCTREDLGSGRHCPHRTVLGILGRDGAFAEYVSLPLGNLLLVPDNVSDEAAVFTEPIAAAYEVFEQLPSIKSQSVLVIGDGRLAQLIARVLKTEVADLTVVGKHENKLAILREAGCQTLLSDQVPDRTWDVAVEATGHPSGLEMATQRVRPRGTIVLKSTYAGGTSYDFAPLVINEVTVLGSRCGRFAPAIDLLTKGAIDPLPLIHDRFSLENAVEAFTEAKKTGILKVLLKMP